MSTEGAEKVPTSDEKAPEVLSPVKETPPFNVFADITAQISQYTDRPDLLLEVIEKHDPGFVASINKDAAEFSKKTRDTRFNFGKHQAYGSLAVQVIAALALIGAVFFLIHTNNFNFSNALGIAIIYAVSQGGIRGFLKIISGVTDAIGKGKTEGDQRKS